MQRVTKRSDQTGELVARYINNNPDHFAHARGYSEAALPLAVSLAVNADINNLL
jgi:hypothetical protein